MYECRQQFRGKSINCIDPEKVCDGDIDCDNANDERHCSFCVPGRAFLCQEQSCGSKLRDPKKTVVQRLYTKILELPKKSEM